MLFCSVFRDTETRECYIYSMSTTHTTRPADLTASIARVRALAAQHGVTAADLDQAEARAMWTLANDRRMLKALGVKAADELDHATHNWAIACLAVQAELVAVFAGQIEHTEATCKAAAMVRRAAR